MSGKGGRSSRGISSRDVCVDGRNINRTLESVLLLMPYVVSERHSWRFWLDFIPSTMRLILTLTRLYDTLNHTTDATCE